MLANDGYIDGGLFAPNTMVPFPAERPCCAASTAGAMFTEEGG